MRLTLSKSQTWSFIRDEILIDFIKALRFNLILFNWQLAALLQHESVSLNVAGSSITTTERSEHLCKSWSTFWKFWDFIKISLFSLFCSSRPFILQAAEFLQKSLRSQSTPQNQEIKKWHSLSCSQINLFRQKWRNEKSEISRTQIYESNFETISKNERRQHSKKQQSTH